MGNRFYALITGLFILILTAAIAVIGYWLSNTGIQRSPYVVVSYGNLTGLSESSAVLYRGVAAGQVESIRFNPDDSREILVTIRIDQTIPITRGSYASLRPQGITGLSQLELNDSGEDPTPLPGDESNPPRIPMQEGFLDRLASSGESVLENFDTLMVNLNALMETNGGRIDAVLANLETATAQADDLAKRLDTALKTIPEVSGDLRKLIASAARLIEEATALLPRLGEIADNTHALTETGLALGGELNDATVPRLNQALDELRATNRQLESLLRDLRGQPQSLLLGAPRAAPGPGEPGYQAGQ